LDDVESVFIDQKRRIGQYSITKDGTLYEPLTTQKRKRQVQKKRLSLDYSFTTFINIYPDLENPNGECKISRQSTHTAPQIQFIKDNMITNAKGYRMAKATHGVWVNKWYYEVQLLNNDGACRIGWSQISGDLQAPCGYDQFSYSFRSKSGLFHDSMETKLDPPITLSSGDILGCLIDLGTDCTDEKFKGLQIDTKLLTRLWDQFRMDEYLPFRHKEFEKLPASSIQFYINGVKCPVIFKSIYQGQWIFI
jgi:hypothetical protein